jgi:hypothetical protein
MKKFKKILKILILSPVFLIGMILIIIGVLGASSLILGKKIMKKIGAL